MLDVLLGVDFCIEFALVLSDLAVESASKVGGSQSKQGRSPSSTASSKVIVMSERK